MGIHAFNRDARLARIYCEGVTASNAGALRNTNPYDPNSETQQFNAWDTGWLDDDGGAADLSMCCIPKPGLQSPELSGGPRY